MFRRIGIVACIISLALIGVLDVLSAQVPQILVQGVPIHGTNGIMFDSNDQLYIASVNGREIVVMDPETGEILDRLGPDMGVEGPDDLTFGPDGSLYWTAIMTGEVGRLSPDGVKTSQIVVPGVNPITFSDDGRLFVALDFLGDGLYELDPNLTEPPRLIIEALGFLNAFDFGPDGLLYGPIWTMGQVVRIDVDTGEMNIVTDGIGIPAAVKFNSLGQLHVLDHLSGEVLSVDTETGDKEIIAQLPPGLDNLAFDSQDRLFVSHTSEGSILEVLPDGTARIVSPGGMISPGGVAVLARDDGGESVFVTDLFTLREFDSATGEEISAEHSWLGVPGSIITSFTVSSDNSNLLLSSWFANAVQVWDPETHEELENYADFAVPLNAIRFQGDLVVAELGQEAGAARVVRTSGVDPSDRITLADATTGLFVPAGLAATDDDLWVSDWATGMVLQLVADGEQLAVPRPVAMNLASPEGMVVAPDGSLLVVETKAGRLSRVDLMNGKASAVAEGLALDFPGVEGYPPTWGFNGVAVGQSGDIYITDTNGNLLTIPPPDPETNKALELRIFEEVWNQGAVDVLDEILAADYVIHDPNGEFAGPEGYRQFHTLFNNAFSDIHFVIEDQAAEGDMVATRWSSTSVHTGELMGIPPTGAAIEITGITVSHIVDGKIVEEWNSWDVLAMMQQIGAAPPSRESYVWGDTSEVTGEPGDPEANIAFVIDSIERVWNQQDLDAVDETFSSDFVCHSPVEDISPWVGTEITKQVVAAYLESFPDMHVTNGDVFAVGDKVVVRWTTQATHGGELMGIPPTGKQVTFTGNTIYRMADGMIVENWWAWDAMGLMQQLTAAATEMANKAIARSVFEEVWNQNNLDLIDELAAPDFISHNPPSPDNNGPEAYKATIAMYLAAFPDTQWAIEDEIASGDLVSFRMTGTGSHQGNFMGLPATGVHMTVTMISTVQIVGGKIVETWSNADQLGLMQQLGVIAPDRPVPENYMWGAQSEVTGDPGTPEANEAVIMRMMNEFWNGKNVDVASEIMVEDLVSHNPPASALYPSDGLENLKQFAADIFTAFPDFQVTFDDLIFQGDKAVGRWRSSGTHQDAFMGIPATGRHISVTGQTVYRFADGKIVEMWWSWDALGMMQQMTMSQAEYNKAVVIGYFAEVWNQGNIDLVEKYLSEESVSHVPEGDQVGIEGGKQHVALFLSAFPDVQFTFDDIIAERDIVSLRWTSQSTHTGELMGIPPTGLPVSSTGILTAKIANGKLMETWSSVDLLGMMQQLGAVTPGRPTPEDYLWSAPSEVTGEAGDPEANKALTMRYADEVFNQGDLGVIDEIFNAEPIGHNPPIDFMYGPSSLETTRQSTTDYLTAFPDFHVTVEELIAEGDNAVGRWTFTGTHQVELMGIPPTGNPVTVSGHTMYRFADGKIVETWWAWDVMGMMAQLTAVPEGYDNVFFTTLSAGLNMISVPLEPVIPFTARSLAEYISATVVIRYDEFLGKFVGFTPAASGDGFSIEGGKGYIVNVLADGTVAFTGAAWTNSPPVEAAPPAQTSSAWAFVVSGSVLDGDAMSASDGDYTAVVKNLRTDEIFAESVDTDGYFATAWADLSRKAVIGAGDKVEVAVVDSSGGIVSGPFIHDITLDSIRNAVVNVHLKLGYIIPAESVLLQNYPNPFNPETWIPYHLSDANPVVISIYNATGQLVRTLDLGHRDAGIYASRSKAAYWDGRNESGEAVASGIYFYSITAGDYTATRKMTVTK
ncbi:ester cyclase [Candidatus Poribacteria bacterium]